MTSPLPEIVRRAREAFADDLAALPPLTLRGGNDIDSYEYPGRFDPAVDTPTDQYLEGFAFWGLGYLDARSWRHYLPRLIEYALQYPDDPAMVAEALLRSLRPPDRYPPRLGSLSPVQEGAVIAFLELVALGDAFPHLRDDAQQALEEWWLPNPRSRPSPEAIATARQVPTAFRVHDAGAYRLDIPEGFAGSGLRDIPEESRQVQTWGGYLHYDAHAVIAINISPIDVRSLAEAEQARATLFRDPPAVHDIAVGGARKARRLDGMARFDSPAEPQRVTLVLAENSTSLVTLSVRAWPREDVDADVERVIRSLELAAT